MKQKLTVSSKLVLVMIISLAIVLTACGDSSDTDDTEQKTITTESGLQYTEIEEGDGPMPQAGDQVQVHYVLSLEDGTQVQSSVEDMGAPFEFTLGTGEVIKGWDEGIAMMKEGGKAKLIVPPELGYGDQDKGNIPPNSTLTFEVELVSVYSEAEETPAEPSDKVNFSDNNLESAIREAIGKPDEDIYQPDLQGLDSLIAKDKDITDLTGIENCTSLTKLSLTKNQISDLSPLSDLTSLTELNLWDNQISDISPLSNLISLTTLRLFENQISDISPLSNLTNVSILDLWDNEISDITPLTNLPGLTELDLWDNDISDISPLSNLISLVKLSLAKNEISDISPLSGLTGLTHLWLYKNRISDISPLSALTGLTNLYIWNNQISDISPLDHLISLTTLSLSGNQIVDISALSNPTSLTWVELEGNQITDVAALSSLNNLIWLNLHSNQISDISSLVENAGLDETSTVDLGNNPLSTTAIEESIPQLEERDVIIKI